MMAEHHMFVPYLDMPIQHADPTVLRNMGRPSDVEMTRRLVAHARERLPDVAMRTTLIVGYPGETDEQFQRLYDFVEEMAFDHVGVFPYSYEKETKSALLPDPVPEEIAEERRATIMELQQRISLKKNWALVGRTLEVLVEAVGEIEDELGHTEPVSVGRGRRHAPEVDGLVFIPGAQPVGELIQVRVTEASPYDLWALPEDQLVDRPRWSRGRGSRLRAVTQPERRARTARGARATHAGR
jgi:ribosomal protein S12 methylthiotransferase